MDCPSFLHGGGEMGGLMRAHDWTTSPLGSPATWPEGLRAVVGLMINSRYPMFLAWGPELSFLYNDGYIPILGGKHPHSIGRPFKEVWSEIWSDIEPLVHRALAGEATLSDNLHLVMERNGYREDTWYSFSYSPVRNETGAVVGMFCACAETTANVLADRRRDALLKLEDALRDVMDTADLSFVASQVVGEVLGAARVGYGEVDPAAGTIAIERNWYAPGYDDLAGTHRFADYGSYIDDLRRGEAVANADVVSDPRTAANAHSFEALGIRAHLDVPVIEQGQTTGQIFVHSETPRRWTDDEIIFVRKVAERTRSAIARRRAEHEVINREIRLRKMLEIGTVGVVFFDLAGGITDANDAFLRMIGYTREELEAGAVRYENLTPREWTWRDEQTIHELLERGESIPFEKQYTHKDGSLIWIHCSGKMLDEHTAVEFIIDVTQRKQTEKALVGSEERLRLAVGNADIGFWDVNEVDHTLVWPARTKGMFGISAEVPVTMDDFYNGLHPDDREATSVAYAAAADPAKRALYDVEYRTVGKEDGIVRWVAAKGRGVFDGTGPNARCLRVAGTAIDITARKATEEALAQNESLLSAVIDAAPVGVILAAADGKIVRDNAASREMWIVAPETHDRERYGAWVGYWPENGERIRAEEWALSRALRTGETVRDELVESERFGSHERRLYLNNAAPVRNAAGEIAAGVVFAVDVTERVRTERRLRFLNQLDAALRVSRDAVASMAAASELLGTYLNVSRCAYAAVDNDGDSFVIHQDYVAAGISSSAGDYSLDLFGPRAASDMRNGEVLVIRNVTAELAAGAGREIFQSIGIEAIVCCPLVKDGRLAAMMAVHQNVSRDWQPDEIALVLTVVERCWAHVERVGAEARLRLLNETLEARVEARTAELMAAQEALRQSQKMEAMGQLTGGVAHDFNNLLTPIVGSLDLLQRKKVGDEREQRLIAGAMQSADRAKTLVQRLLAFARRQPLQPVAVDVISLIQGMADLVSSTTGPQIKVVVDLASDLPAAIADPNQLEMALLNLSVNARDAMPEGGTLRITGSANQLEGGNSLSVLAGTYLRLSVADTGLGMDDETINRAIEPFFSTKGVGKGTGLGLSMVHGLALQLGGALRIQSRKGLGTNVELWLPAAADVPTRTSRELPGIQDHIQRGTALLVDDEDLVRTSVAEMLRDLGFRVVEAASAEAALEEVNAGLKVDVLVTDHLMPGMTGTDLARALGARDPALRVLIVSGYAESEGVAPDLPRLTKPFRRDELRASLAGYIC